MDQLEEKHRLVVILLLGQDLPIQEFSQILKINQKGEIVELERANAF